jgi:hypothetical protein
VARSKIPLTGGWSQAKKPDLGLWLGQAGDGVDGNVAVTVEQQVLIQEVAVHQDRFARGRAQVQSSSGGSIHETQGETGPARFLSGLTFVAVVLDRVLGQMRVEVDEIRKAIVRAYGV